MAKKQRRKKREGTRSYKGYCPIIDVHCTVGQSDRRQCFIKVGGRKFKTRELTTTNAKATEIAELQRANRCNPAFISSGLGGRGLSPTQQIQREYRDRIKALQAEMKAAKAASKRGPVAAPSAPVQTEWGPEDWELRAGRPRLSGFRGYSRRKRRNRRR